MDIARKHWTGVGGLLTALKERLVPQRGTVGAVANGLYTVQFTESDQVTIGNYARIGGFKINPGDEVECLSTDGDYIVLGGLSRGVPTGYALDAPLTLDDGRIAGMAPMAPVYSDTSTTASTTNTSTYVPAISTSFTLPSIGTWDIFAIGFLGVKNSGPVGVNLRLNINGVAQTVSTVTPIATAFRLATCFGFQTGLSGSNTVLIEFKGSGASTTSTESPGIWAWARRTA